MRSSVRYLLFILLLVFPSLHITAQQTQPKIANLKMRQDSRKFIISYDIVGFKSDSAYRIDFYVIDNIGNVVFPDSITGDFGDNISGGSDKEIIWDIYSEFDVVYGTFDPRIIINGHEGYSIKTGPSAALLSVAVPGLGDYFVANHSEMIIKPYMRTVSSLGFTALGVAALKNREWVDATWIAEREVIGYHFEGQRNWVYGPYIQPAYKVIDEHHNYWLFKWDSEVFFTIGAAIWAADIVWVILKGRKNLDLERSLKVNYSVDLYRNIVNMGLIYRF